MALTKYDPDGLHHWAPRRKFGGGCVCFKSSPKAPQAPDPVATANAQTASNIDTANAQAALNRNNQYTPWGSQTWTQGPQNADGTSQWSSTISLDPAQQKLLDSSNDISQLLAGLGIKQAGQVDSAISQPIDYNRFTQVQNNPLQTGVAPGAMQTQVGQSPLQMGIPNGGNIQSGVQGAGNIRTGAPAAGPLQDRIGGAGTVQRGMDTSGTENFTRNVDAGPLQREVNMSGVPQLVGGDALRGAMQDNQGAAYRQQAAYLDSSYSQRQRDLENQLVQQGVTQNSDAWNRAVNNLGEQRTFDYNNAFNNSFTTGLQANNQLFGQGLAVNQNAYGQALNNGQFANNAQAQQFAQGQANANLNNASNAQLAAQRLAQMQAGNAAQAQQYGQNANDASFSNATQAQRFGQGLQAGQFTNAAQAQQYSQNANDMTQANAAQAQLFGQGLAGGQFANSAAGQRFGQDLAAGQFTNAAQNQQFGQGMSNAGLSNAASQQGFGQSMGLRQQQINEALQQQQTPLNILNALRSGSQVSAPQFGGTPQGNVAPTDIAGMYNNQYQGQLSAYNGQIAQNNATTGALGSAAMAAALYFSDRRLKMNVQRIGTHPLGIGVYAYDYVWGEPAVGVMADEVERVMPYAVATHPSGYKMVNYGVL